MTYVRQDRGPLRSRPEPVCPKCGDLAMGPGDLCGSCGTHLYKQMRRKRRLRKIKQQSSITRWRGL